MVDVVDSGHVASVPPSCLLEALSAVFTYPAQGLETSLQLLEACAHDGACATWLDGVDGVLKAAQTFKTADAEGSAEFEAVQLEYTRLFIGSFKMYAPPYASYYLDEGGQVQGPVAFEVEALYGEFGLQLGCDEHDCPDHLRYLLAFSALLMREYEQSSESAFAEAFHDFAAMYLLSWLPRFQRLVERHAHATLYPAAVRLLLEVVGEAREESYEH